jgi:tRNA threonylcarbamoyladenosine biosynthesis protein TsaB
VILALDSSTASLSIALLKEADGGLIPVLERRVSDGGKHGHRLPQCLDELLATAGLQPGDLDACAVGLGPGSFTGLRVGLATLKGLCYARRIPLRGISSLRAMAREESGLRPNGLYCPLLDARRGEVYAGLYRGSAVEPVTEEVVIPPASVPDWLRDHGGAEAILFGQGLHAYLEALRSALGDPTRLDPRLDLNGPQVPSAVQVAQLARSAEPFRMEALFALEPHYLRPFTADPPRTRSPPAGRPGTAR